MILPNTGSTTARRAVPLRKDGTLIAERVAGLLVVRVPA